MRIDEKASYFMPVSAGPSRPLKAGVFEDVWSLSVSYRTDKDALASRLPTPFEPADDPIVTVYYMKCGRVNFLAGGSYNMMGLNLATRFNGTRDQIGGNYALVLWENEVAPIIRGRELLGVPKLYADIPDPHRIGDDWRVQTAENGKLLVEMKISRARPLTRQALTPMKAEMQAGGLDGVEVRPERQRYRRGRQPADSNRHGNGFERSVGGGGSVTYGEVSWETNPTSADMLAASRILLSRSIRETGSLTARSP